MYNIVDLNKKMSEWMNEWHIKLVGYIVALLFIF